MLHPDINSNYNVFLRSISATAPFPALTASATPLALTWGLDFLFQEIIFCLLCCSLLPQVVWHSKHRGNTVFNSFLGKRIWLWQQCLMPSAEIGFNGDRWIGAEGKSIYNTESNDDHNRNEKKEEKKPTVSGCSSPFPLQRYERLLTDLSEHSCWCRYSLSQLPPDATAVSSYQRESLTIFLHVNILETSGTGAQINTELEG